VGTQTVFEKDRLMPGHAIFKRVQRVINRAKDSAERQEIKSFIDRSTKIIKLNEARIAKEEEVSNFRASIDGRTNHLIYAIKSEFDRINAITKAKVRLDTKIIEGRLWVTFSRGEITRSVVVPLPKITDKGLELLVNNDVVRVLCDYWLERGQKRLNYHEIIESLFCEDVNVIKPTVQSGSPMVHKVVKSFDKDQVAYMVSNLQRLINEIVNVMPLHETDMNSWAMNKRLVIIDPYFESIADPNERLDYQVHKNRIYYEKFGWTAIGLSDGVLAGKNYLLTTDLRLLTPFSQYHNPQRNLYSTLCMKGDEFPRIRSKSMQKLMDEGIARRGWNMVTAIMDTPLNFEDQILVDKRHLGLSHFVEKRFVVYGDKLLVKKGEKIKTDDKIGFSNVGNAVVMDMKCDSAYVSSIRKDIVDLNGEQIPVFVVIVKGKRFLRDGSKFSNLHGNKGMVRFLDLGYAIDPRNGESVPLDVIISGKSIDKRKNYGQILEALLNNVKPGDDPIVVEDDTLAEKIKVKEALKRVGLPEDGTWMIDTYCGEKQAIVGKMFWGVTKDPEDQAWNAQRTEVTNNRELRTSGLKFSHVEMKALTTRFGQNNPLLKEISSE